MENQFRKVWGFTNGSCELWIQPYEEPYDVF